MVLGTVLSRCKTSGHYEEARYLAYLNGPLAKERLKNYARHVVSRTIAFNDVTPFKARTEEARKKFNWFARRQKNSRVYQLPKSYADYNQIVGEAKHKEEMMKRDPQDFELLETDSVSPLHIIDRDGVLMGYRIRVPIKYLDRLNSTDHLIPSKKKNIHQRGNTVNQHWTVWR